MHIREALKSRLASTQWTNAKTRYLTSFSFATAILTISLSRLTMKLNISYPVNGTQKLIEIDDERKLRVFMDRRMGQVS